MTTFTLEPIGEADFAFRYRVYEAAIKPYIDRLFDWDDAKQEAFVRSNLTSASNHAAIVVGGERVGIAQIAETDARISLDQVEILPAHQGKGIGTALIASLQARAAETGKPIHLSVFRLNVGARHLYERLGFRETSATERDVQMIWTPPGRPGAVSASKDRNHARPE